MPETSGIPAAAFAFYDALVANNTRAWWTDHKAEYERYVHAPMAALLDALAEEFGPGKLFRPYNDSRFHKSKPPIKEHQGGVVHVEDAVAYYVQVSAQGLLVAGGWYSPAGPQINRYREAVAGPSGTQLDGILRGLGSAWSIDGNALKTFPRGYDPEHPRIALLRNRRLSAAREYGIEPWMSTSKALTTIRRDWRKVRPLVEWLADNVGPASDPAHEPLD